MADNFNLRQFLSENKLTKNAKLLKEETSLDGRIVDMGSIEIDGIDTEDYPDFSDAYIAYAEFEDGTPLSEDELMRLEEENYGLVNDLAHESLHEDKEPVMESTLTVKERRLVEMVQDALGITPQTVAEEAPMAEDEMVQEKPLPKYENIEKLMQEIEHGTNEAAYKHKMAKMKEVAEMLEARVSSLEEGDGAEFVDTKKVKQMKKDIMTLRKQAEKLEKEYDKKFGEKKSKKRAGIVENFNLKKFLVENKLTTNSRMLKEEPEYGESQEVVYQDDTERVLLVYEPTEDGTSYNPETGMEGEDMPWYTVSDAYGEDWEVLNSYFEKPTYEEVSQDVKDFLDSLDKEFDEKGFNTDLFGNIRKIKPLQAKTSTFSANESKK